MFSEGTETTPESIWKHFRVVELDPHEVASLDGLPDGSGLANHSCVFCICGTCDSYTHAGDESVDFHCASLILKCAASRDTRVPGVSAASRAAIIRRGVPECLGKPSLYSGRF